MVSSSFQRVILVLVISVGLVGCASRRSFEVSGDPIRLENGTTYYIVFPEMTEKVVYNGFHPFNYDKYGRENEEAKPDVPGRISQYLEEKGNKVTLGPAEEASGDFDFIISYVELWGWDLRDIIKSLTIEFRSSQSRARSTVEFNELTFFNTQPTAKGLVPQMLDVLFGIDENR